MFEQELAFANELADRAAEIALSFFRSEFEVRRKADATPVTDADLAIEQMIRAAVAERFPEDAVLGEEGGAGGHAERTWIVDPIDGTKNFARGIQVWATLIALRSGDRMVLGMAGAPALGERYEAVRGRGARLNGEPIRVSGIADLREGQLLVGGDNNLVGTPWEREYLRLVSEAGRVRGFGDFWGHLLVARGSAEVMLEPELNVWDWAALEVIVEESGGRMTQLDGSPPEHGGSVLTTNSLLHDEVVARLRATSR